MSRPACKVPTGLVPALRALGIDPAEVLDRARLPRGLFDQAQVRLDVEPYHALWRAIAELSGDPKLGLVLAQGVETDHTEPLFLAMLSSANVGAALEVVARYKRVLSPEELDLRHHADEVELEYVWPGARPPPLLVDVELAFIVEMCRRGTRTPELSPRRVCLAVDRLAIGAEHERFFGCPVTLDPGRRGNTLVFAQATCERPLETHNAAMLDALLPYLSATVPPRSELDRARSIIASQLTGRRPTVGEVSRAMAMSPRSLQRLLAQHDTSFRQLLADVRRELATTYIRGTQFDDHEIAFLLGFDDPNSFTRAFRGWNGESPGEYRRRHGDATDLA